MSINYPNTQQFLPPSQGGDPTAPPQSYWNPFGGVPLGGGIPGNDIYREPVLRPEFENRIADIYGRVNSLQQRMQCLEGKIGEPSKTAKEIAEIRDSVAALSVVCAELTEITPNGSGAAKPQHSYAIHSRVYRGGPSTLEKVAASILTVIAILAIASLVCCLAAITGCFPILLTMLNACSLGAVVALPVVSGVASIVATICLLSTYILLCPSKYYLEQRLATYQNLEAQRRVS